MREYYSVPMKWAEIHDDITNLFPDFWVVYTVKDNKLIAIVAEDEVFKFI